MWPLHCRFAGPSVVVQYLGRDSQKRLERQRRGSDVFEGMLQLPLPRDGPGERMLLLYQIIDDSGKGWQWLTRSGSTSGLLFVPFAHASGRML